MLEEPTLIQAAWYTDDLTLISWVERKKCSFNRNYARHMYLATSVSMAEIIHMSRHDDCVAGLNSGNPEAVHLRL